MIRPKKYERQIEQIFPAASASEKSAPSLLQAEDPLLEPAELAHLRQFFDLLAEWNESQDGEPKDE